MFERVLCRDHEKWRGKRKALLSYRYLTFFHGFEEGGLHFRGSTVDLIGEENVGEDRSLSDFEFARLRTINLVSSQVRGEKVRGE